MIKWEIDFYSDLNNGLGKEDICAISRSGKSWLYADLYEELSEAVMSQQTTYGILGVKISGYLIQV